VEPWSADRVWAQIESLSRAQPGGVLAMDADGTLWSGDVGDDLFHAFLRHGRVETPAFEAIRREARDCSLSDAGGGADVARRLYDAYVDGRYPEERMCEAMAWCFAGWTKGEVRAFARDVVDKGGLTERLQGETVGLLSRARQAGLVTVVVSASPADVVVEAASRIDIAPASVVAARSLWHEDVMLPDVERPIPFGDGKVSRLREHIGPDRTLYAAFGDNAFDVALLASARLGVAVRPKARLRSRANEVPGLVELQALNADGSSA
jgi:phosphatidylglycerophosphatase C